MEIETINNFPTWIILIAITAPAIATIVVSVIGHRGTMLMSRDKANQAQVDELGREIIDLRQRLADCKKDFKKEFDEKIALMERMIRANEK